MTQLLGVRGEGTGFPLGTLNHYSATTSHFVSTCKTARGSSSGNIILPYAQCSQDGIREWVLQ